MTQIPLMIGGGLFIIMLVIIGWLAIANANKDTRIATLEGEKAAFESTNTDLKNSIIKYDEAMKTMRKQAAERAAQVARDKVKASILNKRYESIADNIAKMKAPTKNDCQNAQVLLKNYLRGSK